jgi:ketosteroid isomerase-like protein
MSKENVEIVRRIMDAWNRADLDAGAGLISPEVEVEVAMGTLIDGTYRGLEEALRFLAEFWSQFKTYRSDMTECIPAGDKVLVGVIHSGIGKGSGVEVELRSWQAWEFRDGQLVRWRNFAARADALKAAGLSG